MGDQIQTEDVVLAAVVGCVVCFYLVSFCVIGCTRHSVRMQTTTFDDEDPDDAGAGRG